MNDTSTLDMARFARAPSDPAMPVPDPGAYGDQTPHTAPQAGPPEAPLDDEPFRRVVDGAHATVDHLADVAAPHVQTLQRQLQAVGDALDADAGPWGERARQTIRDHPLGAVAAALAVGVLVARALR